MCVYQRYYCPNCNKYSHTTILRQCRADQNCVTIYHYKRELEDEEECHQCDSENVEE
jgi:hypothetical protein